MVDEEEAADEADDGGFTEVLLLKGEYGYQK